MSIFSIILTALGLSMDAFAVSLSGGMTSSGMKRKHALKYGVYFGFFQAVMPIIGYLLGRTFSGYISAYDHWIAFLLLFTIGTKMLYETFQADSQEIKKKDASVPGHKSMLILAVATSIDAMAVGISMAVINVDILLAAAIIGAITLFVSVSGVLLGKKLSTIFSKNAERLGGLILIGIGTKILIEHIIAG